jgi:hypothetical protein
MHRTLLIVLAVLLTFRYSIAQQAIKTDFDYVTKRMTFPPLIQQLTKEDKYAVLMPKKLTFHPYDYEVTGIWNPYAPLAITIPAKVHTIKPDYIFEISTGGVSHLDSQAVRFFKTKRYEPNGTSKEVNGILRDYTCNFPCKLTIKNKTGEVIRTVEIAGEKEVFTVTLHKDLLSSTEVPVNPFFSELSLTDFTSYNNPAIRRRIEEKVGYQVFNRVATTIAHLYNVYNSYKEVYGFGFVKLKNRPYDYNDLDSAVAHYKIALDSMHTGNMEACKTICQSIKPDLEKLLQSTEPRIDKGVKEAIYYNLSHLNLLTQNFDEAWKYYQLILPGYETSSAERELKARIVQHETYFKLKAQISN